jgi:glycosyl transferase family 25
MIPTLVCISLIDQVQRRSFMRQQLDALGLPYRFFDAVRIDLSGGWPESYDRQQRLAYAGRDLTAGEIGCYLSHRAIWQQLLSGPDEVALVLEDDVAVPPDFGATVQALCEGPDDWDFARLYGCFKRPMRPLRPVHGAHVLVDYLSQPRGMQGYLVKRRAAESLLRHTASIVHAIDDAIDRDWEHRLRMRGVEPPVVLHTEAFVSTLGARSTCGLSFPQKLQREWSRLGSNIRKQAWMCRKRLRPGWTWPE